MNRLRETVLDFAAVLIPLACILGTVALAVADADVGHKGLVAIGINHVDNDVEAFAGAPSPREQVANITAGAGAASKVQLTPAAYTTPVSGRCTVLSTAQVYVGPETMTTTADGEGPYCQGDNNTCPLGAVIPVAGRVWAFSAGAPAPLTCRFVDDGLGYVAGAAAGLSQGAADTRYVLKSGDTMTGVLLLPNGTVNAPSWSFAVDPNTGGRWAGADTLSFVTGGSDRLTLRNTNITAMVDLLGTQLTTGTSNYWRVPTIINTAPVKPTCSATTEGGMLYADDTDDAAGGMVCSCIATDMTRTTFAWRQVQDNLLACP